MTTPLRRTMAVMFTDVAGFTALMESDESGAMETLDMVRELLRRRLRVHDGLLVKEMGDGSLSCFPNPMDAVRVAREIQRRLQGREFRLRIGIHFGEVLKDPDDIYGDTVNVASRLEKVCAPGGICVSSELLEAYGRDGKPAAVDLGMCQLKGLGRLIRLFALKGGDGDLPVPRIDPGTQARLGDSPGRVPSLAVIPLKNRGSESDDFYTYGITADLVSDLSRAGGLDVAPLSEVTRLSSVMGSGAVAADRLQADYLVTGSLWRKDTIFHLSLELRQRKSSALIWSDSWQDDWFELPLIKGKLADSILKALGREAASAGMPEGASDVAEAYQLYLRGKDSYRKMRSSAELLEARKLFGEALKLDPALLSARLLLSATYRTSGDLPMAEAIAERAVREAREEGNRNHLLQALNSLGILLWHQGDLRSAKSKFRQVLGLARAVDDRKGEAQALNNLGLMECEMGHYSEAVEALQEALEASSSLVYSGLRGDALCNLGLTHLRSGHMDSALEFFGRSLEVHTDLENLAGQAQILANIAIVHNAEGRMEQAMELDRQALGLSRKLGDLRQVCRNLNNMASIYMSIGLWDKARGLLDEVLELSRENGDRITEGICLFNQGLVSQKTGELDRAEDLFRRSLDMARSTGDGPGEYGSLELLAEHRLAMGDPRGALELMERAISLMDSQGDCADWPESRMTLAKMRVSANPTPAVCSRELKAAEECMRKIEPRSCEESIVLWRSAQFLTLLLKADHWASDQRLELDALYTERVRAAKAKLDGMAAAIEDESWRAALLSIPEHVDLIEAFERLEAN